MVQAVCTKLLSRHICGGAALERVLLINNMESGSMGSTKIT